MLTVKKHAIQEQIFRAIPIATHFETFLSLTGHFIGCILWGYSRKISLPGA